MRGLDIKGQGNKISVEALKKLAKDRERAQLQKQAQDQYDEGSTTFNLSKTGLQEYSGEDADLDRKMMLLEQAEAGSEMAIYELQQAGVDMRIPDADASGLTTWLFAGPVKAGLGVMKGAAMMAGKQGPKWAKAVQKFSDYY